MEDFYAILNINKTATTKEIKKAYAKLLKVYSPETHPEEFKKINMAYRTLSNAASRNAYDNDSGNHGNFNFQAHQSSHGDKINTNYSFKSRTETKSEPEITPKSDYKDVLNLYNEYCNKGKIDEAVNILNAAIDKENRNSSNNIIYYLELIKLYISERDLHNFNLVLNEFLSSMTSDFSEENTATSYIFDQLMNIAISLYSSKKFTYSTSIVRKLVEINSNDKNLKKLVKLLDNIQNSSLLLKKLQRDPTVCTSLKILISLWLNDDMDEYKRIDQIESTKASIATIDKHKLLKSIKRLKSHYNKLILIDQAYFNKLESDLNKPSSGTLFSLKFTCKTMLMIIICVSCFSRIFSGHSSSPAPVVTHPNATPSSYSTNKIEEVKKHLPSSVYVPSSPPAGYSFSNCTMNFMSGSSPNNFKSACLIYTKGSSTIKFYASVVSSVEWTKELSGQKLENINFGNDTFTYAYDSGKQELLFKKRPNGTATAFISIEDNDSNSNTSNSTLYKITTNLSSNLSKENLINIAENLKR